MKYVNVKRMFLNIGLLIALAAVILSVRSLWINRNIIDITATVISEEKSDVGYVEYGSKERTYPYSDYEVEYEYEGRSYHRTILRDTGTYAIGDIAPIEIDKSEPDSYAYRSYESDFIIIVPLAVIAALLIVSCRSAFRGYREEFIGRYPKACIFTAVSPVVPIIYYFTAYLHPEPAWIMEGLAEAVTLLFLTAAVPLADMIVWIVAVASYVRKMKIADSSILTKE
ncbi:MAG: hypothetical protein ACI4KF_08740 [Huintestinicola sp.]